MKRSKPEVVASRTDVREVENAVAKLALAYLPRTKQLQHEERAASPEVATTAGPSKKRTQIPSNAQVNLQMRIKPWHELLQEKSEPVDDDKLKE